MDTIRHRYVIHFEYDTVGDEQAALPEDIEADAYRGLHNYYVAAVTVVHGPEAI